MGRVRLGVGGWGLGGEEMREGGNENSEHSLNILRVLKGRRPGKGPRTRGVDLQTIHWSLGRLVAEEAPPPPPPSSALLGAIGGAGAATGTE
jgi:hypothetical protein